MTSTYKHPLRLYRALLREASYLFDKAGQEFHAKHIQWSFRRQQGVRKASQDDAVKSSPSKCPSQYESQQLKRGRKYLYMLQRANQGYVGAVRNVLRLTYAKRGKRRREMLRDIMTPSATDPMSTEAKLPVPTNYSKTWRPPTHFTMLLKAQEKLQNHLDLSGKIKSLPKIPEKNRWNKPFPTSRVRRILKEWYVKHAGLLLPPLSEKEWATMYAMTSQTSGSAPIKVPQRRPQGISGILSQLDKGTQPVVDCDLVIKSTPLASTHEHSKRVRRILGNPHHLTPRFLRRILQRDILRNSSTILANHTSNKLASRWEPGVVPPPVPRTCTDSQKVSLFD